MKRKHYRVVAILLVLVAMAAAASVAMAQVPANQQGVANPGETPFLNQWRSSGHADIMGEAFNDWNDTNPPAVPTTCAKCHSTPGFLDYLGMDGTAFRTVDRPAPIGTTVQCIACHNDKARTLTSVRFPSGIELGLLESANRCAECHQGRSSKVQVDAAIQQQNLTDSPDTVNANLSFLNIHYYAAAATLYGSEAKGGYEYAGMVYQPRFRHVEGYETCINCHDPHSLEIKINECAGCHEGVTPETLRNIRMRGSGADYDGDGNTSEGIAMEITTLQEKLINAIKAYAVQVSKPIGYTSAAHPYFFIDTNANGQIEASEAVSANRYNGFTPRLLKAAYNYQVSLKDPGAFAHNAKYIIQLLHDSINDLNERLGQPGIGEAQRDDPGHFAATHEAWRHWDAEGEVPATCTKCHTSDGLPIFLKNGVTIALEPSESMKCTTCHANQQNWALLDAGASVAFPSGARLSMGTNQSNLCIQCHQGLVSKVQVDNAIRTANVGVNEPSTALAFQNPHYFAAGATLFGTQAKGAYEYDGKQYNGRFMHVESHDTCTECHSVHRLEVRASSCASCHPGTQTQLDLYNIRLGSPADFDTDGNTSEGIAQEIEGVRMMLLESIQRYATGTIGTSIAYDSHAHPYWYKDSNGNGTADADEVNAGNRYNQFSPRLLRAAYNYQWVSKDPGAFAHNADYILQIMYDSIQDLGGNVSGMTRPAVR